MDKIYNILQNYLQELSNKKIENDYTDIKNINNKNKENLERLFKKYISEDPKILNKYTEYQIGGFKQANEFKQSG
jgi:hypothetical protein